MNSIISPCRPDTPSWQARLQLEVRSREGKSCLSRCRHEGPLYVQKAFYPEGQDLAHLYLLHPPGGLVSGDHLSIDVNVGQEGRSLITTPGAARMYRARDNLSLQRQTINLQLAEGASLEWFPLETIVFNGACVDLKTTIELEAESQFIGWELTCFGLPASGDMFRQGSFKHRYCIEQEGLPAFVELLSVTPDSLEDMLEGSAALRGEPVTGLFIAGPFAQPLGEDELQEIRSATSVPGADLSQVDSYLIGRYLGGSAEQGRRAFTSWWAHLRPLLLGRKACAPRIWLT